MDLPCTTQTLWMSREGPLRLVCDLKYNHEGAHQMTVWHRLYWDICTWTPGQGVTAVRTFDDWGIKKSLDRILKATD